MSAPASSRAGRLGQLVLTFVLLAFCAAPVPGDVGGCSQRGELLDAGAFFDQKAALDCARCERCGIDTQSCERACKAQALPTEFPKDCYPLVHDGEACLRALDASGCASYGDFMRDSGASTPTECDFCPVDAP